MEIGNLIHEMILHNEKDIRRVQHLLKVYTYAKTIGVMEKLDKRTQEILEVAAVVHDIGIKLSEKKYKSSAGNYQEIEGPPEANKLLLRLGYDEDLIKRVCFLVGHHHTYNNIEGLDYQILVEADFLVNLYEKNVNEETIKNVEEKIFKTNTGIKYLKQYYR